MHIYIYIICLIYIHIQSLGCILDSGWLPPHDWGDPVTWRRREQNTAADHLVNYTMDTRASWSECLDWPFPGHRLSDCNVILHADGGTRSRQCSASAWVLDVGIFTSTGWKFEPLVFGGHFYDEPISSFTAEALALAESSLLLKSVVSGCIRK